ncbi:hypothetical protein CDIK_1435 [Cucumispora dikerogammari]|nr:hypothetical protein CDIK_1435 [Cucumispora dikerogammari]
MKAIQEKQEKISVVRLNVISKFQVEFGHEDYTLMSPLQHLIAQNYDSEDVVEISGFSKLHPTDETIVLRIQFEDQSIQSAEKVLEKTFRGCELLMEATSDILSKLNSMAL